MCIGAMPMLSRSAAGGEDRLARRRPRPPAVEYRKKESALAHSSAETHRAALAAAYCARVKRSKQTEEWH
jgi:hypothetical protein